MCGINGFNWGDKVLIQKMMASTVHRGPDDSGEISISSSWSLGHNRLSIVDLSSNGHQPMEIGDGNLSIVFNGEIYNFKEIREELLGLGYRFRSQTDTEVVISAYKEWGESCVHKFNGMFAFAILNKTTREVFIARDRVGIKPLYYYAKNGKFIFSSEIKAILVHGISSELDIDSLNSIFRVLYVPAPKTAWSNIQKLPPGHVMNVSKIGEAKVKQYWSIPESSEITDKRFILDETKRLLLDSVRLQLVSDRPVGIFLSGGLDSTIIAGIASQMSQNIQTFSVGYEDTEESDKYNNDRILAKKTSEIFGTKHHEYILSANDIADNIEKSIYHMDEPISNHIQAVNMLLAQKVSTQATVVLGGDGGDELFGGYERYYYNQLIERWQKLPGLIRRSLIGKIPFALLGRDSSFDAFQTPPGVDRYLNFFAKKENVVASFLKPEFNRPNFTRNYFKSLYFKNIESDFTRQLMRTDVYSWLPNESLVRSDKMSMSASIEQRVPFLDHRLIEFADRIPVHYKLGKKGFGALNIGRGYGGKVILREAMEEFLPEHVLKAPKWGWFSPAAKWIRGPLFPLMKEVLSPGYNKGTENMLDFNVLNDMLDKHVRKEKYALNELWLVMTFQIWFRKFMN